MLAISQRKNVHLWHVCATELETTPSKWKVLKPDTVIGQGMSLLFHTGQRARPPTAQETKMWVIKIYDERNENLLGFPPVMPLSEDVRQERSSRCLWLVPDQNISPSAEIYFLPPGPPSPPLLSHYSSSISLTFLTWKHGSDTSAETPLLWASKPPAAEKVIHSSSVIAFCTCWLPHPKKLLCFQLHLLFLSLWNHHENFLSHSWHHIHHPFLTWY